LDARPGNAGDEKAERLRPLDDQAAGRDVGRVAHVFGDPENFAPGFLADVGIAVEGAGNRRNGNPGGFGNVLDGDGHVDSSMHPKRYGYDIGYAMERIIT